MIHREGSKLSSKYNKKLNTLEIYKSGLFGLYPVGEVYTPIAAPKILIHVGLSPDEVRLILDEFLSPAGLKLALDDIKGD